ncbi:MAG: DUF4253 domain-containing protein [Oscillospiraceae bacterium]|nr:DUF4253 domain-containing protein [Oscillospiraceae bacterium]
MSLIEKIAEFLNCEYESFYHEKNPVTIMKRYRELISEGSGKGFTPLIIVPSEILLEDFQEANTREELFANMNQINIQDLFYKMAENFGDAQEIFNIRPSDIETFEIIEKPAKIIGFLDVLTDKVLPEVMIAKIPTKNPWELPLWIPMGGFNDCPAPEEQAVIFKYWFETYGAVPACVTYETWELFLSYPPETIEEALKIAKLQYIFDSDIVDQGCGTVANLAKDLMHNPVWYFWWD